MGWSRVRYPFTHPHRRPSGCGTGVGHVGRQCTWDSRSCRTPAPARDRPPGPARRRPAPRPLGARRGPRRAGART
ncbi:hypothetical protein D0Z06_07135 [Geodermatophilus marinus]|nr:hypothetical protein D0Z06_07135 [Geodermatophilus sp. LHW52908]